MVAGEGSSSTLTGDTDRVKTGLTTIVLEGYGLTAQAASASARAGAVVFGGTNPDGSFTLDDEVPSCTP